MILEPSKHTFNGISYYQNTNTDLAYILVYDQSGHIIVAAKAKYKIASKVATKAGQTDIGKKVIKTSLPYINPLLGSDKIDPFLMDLITSNSAPSTSIDK